jgi:biopolymer transport protein ExbD
VKFPRNARIFRGQQDAAPFAIVFFLLVLFLLLGSLMHTPGVRLELPEAEGLPGIDAPPIDVAIDRNGRLYFENEPVEESSLTNSLRKAVQKSREPLVLVIHADRAVPLDRLMHLAMLGRSSGISNSLLATLPRPQLDAVPMSSP